MKLIYFIGFWNQVRNKIKAKHVLVFCGINAKGGAKKEFYYLCSGACIGYMLRNTST